MKILSLITLQKSYPIHEIRFIWFNTGLEYKATKEHLDFLEDKYGIKIERIMPEKSVVTSCRQHGLPFINKTVSELIARLQKHGFQWEDEPYDVLIQKYPKCKSALKWWCNEYPKPSRFNIEYNHYLKEFLIAHPPTFAISNKCCYYAKKKVYMDFVQKNKCDLDCSGVRKAEGGVRSGRYKDCFSEHEKRSAKMPDGIARLRPAFWLTNADKVEYEQAYGIEHSRCYTEYGMTRTGCAGCPYNLHLKEDLQILKDYEPTLYKACMNVFGKSYEYTEEFHKFRAELKQKEKEERKAKKQLQNNEV